MLRSDHLLCNAQAEVEARPNLWGNFMVVSGDDVPLYAAVPGFDQLRTTLTQQMTEYNESNAAMDLVLFQQVFTPIMAACVSVAGVLEPAAGSAPCLD